MRDLVLLSAARLFRVASVYHIRFGRAPDLAKSGGWEWILLRLAVLLADKVIAIDRATESALKSIVFEGKLSLLPNAIDLNVFRPSAADAKPGSQTLYYLGWVIPTKGMKELMEAWRLLNPQDWELVLAGPVSEPYRSQLACLLAGDSRVSFLGELPHAEAWHLMQQAGAFVFPSHTEGFPVVILEAMAAAKPIIASRVGAIPEMLEDREAQACGMVIEPRDVSALADAMKVLLADSSLRADLGRRARAKVEIAYDINVVFRSLLKIWQDLV